MFILRVNLDVFFFFFFISMWTIQLRFYQIQPRLLWYADTLLATGILKQPRSTVPVGMCLCSAHLFWSCNIARWSQSIPHAFFSAQVPCAPCWLAGNPVCQKRAGRRRGMRTSKEAELPFLLPHNYLERLLQRGASMWLDGLPSVCLTSCAFAAPLKPIRIFTISTITVNPIPTMTYYHIYGAGALPRSVLALASSCLNLSSRLFSRTVMGGAPDAFWSEMRATRGMMGLIGRDCCFCSVEQTVEGHTCKTPRRLFRYEMTDILCD